VCKSYGGVRARQILREVTLEVGRGEFVAVMGESGAGKSTLLNLIAGLDTADSGTIIVGGTDLGALDESARTLFRRDSMGFVFQAFHLLPHLTVAHNVRLPLDLAGRARDEADRRTASMLGAVGIASLSSEYPTTLSGGEAQRTAIARALVNAPALVLADEPTGNLDEESAAEVLALLRENVKQRAGAGVLVTHSEAAARMADRIYVLKAGRLDERTG
jgi:putative ABC transport system ATP-binding protein